jgi:Patatin-like phospholipase
MFDSNRSYCLRLAEVTFPLLPNKPASTAASDAPLSARREESGDPLNVRPSIYDELRQLFGPSCDSCLSSAKSLAEALELRPDIQSRLAVITQYTPSKWLLERELQAFNYWPTPPPERDRDCPPTQDGKPDPYDVARCRAATGLCLSGGGIRSATFNLGALQALSRHGRISKLDYLSSVSGGGYIHQFLANWIYKAGSTSSVEELLDPIPNQPEASPLGYRATVQPEPLRWLRRHSNYLAPRTGAVSLDTWTIAATWTRNTALNLVVLLSTLFFVLLLPYIGTIPFASAGAHHTLFTLFGWILAIIFLIVVSCLSRWLAHLDPPGPKPIFIKLACGSLLGAAVLVAPFIYKTIIPGESIADSSAKTIFHEVEQPTHLHYKGSFQQQTPSAESLEVTVDTQQPVPRSRLRDHWSARPLGLWHGLMYTRATTIPILLFACLCGLLLSSVFSAGKFPVQIGSIVWLLGIAFAYLLLDGVRLLFFVTCFAVPLNLIPSLAVALLPSLLLAVPFVLMEAGLGIVGDRADSGQREWMARLRALSFLLGGSWFAVTGVALLGPHLVHILSHYTVASYTIWAGWLGTTIAGVLSARSTRTDNSENQDSPSSGLLLELLAKIAPPVFVIGLLLILATFVSWSVIVPDGTPIQREHRFLLLFFLSLGIALFFGRRVDINDFSMHAFYRDRLARCYGGAIDLHRIPNLFTGFTRSDRSLRVHQLLPVGYRVLDEQGNPVLDQTGKPIVGTYAGPFPVICTAINLTTGEDLAYQERKAASFTFTPIFSGYNVGWTAARNHWNQFNGFVDTPSFVYQDAGSITLATACAISGAAASPSMGYHSNPTIAFLLTVFNVRLGWWLRNPRRRRIGRVTPYPIPPSPKPDALSRFFTLKPGMLPSSPRFGLLRLVNELFGQSDDTTSYIYLTDGGHFDNMGLYELLRRRCRAIVVCDSEADPHLAFQGIGMAIRKARLDFGIEVTLDQTAPIPPEPPADQKVPGHSRSQASSPSTQVAHDASTARPATTTSSTDPAKPSAEALSQQQPPEVPYVLKAHVSSTDAPGFTATVAHQQSPPAIEGLSSFGEYPANSIHCVHGTIRYPEDSDPSQFGHILYIKASLTGDEPPDILNYRREHKKFPHDTTLNQFFTESQFESYRRLGEHILLSDETIISWMNRYLPVQ